MANYTSPLQNTTVTSPQGPRVSPGGIGSTNHGGTDFSGRVGTPVYSASPGTVSYSGVMGGYGNTIIVSHPDGSSTLYGHLSSRGDTYAGQSVGTDMPIGALGSTGNSTGPHLHYERYQTGNKSNKLSPFGDDSDANSAASKKGGKLSKDGSEAAKKKGEGDQDGTDENDKKNKKIADEKKPLGPNQHKDIKGEPGSYERTTTQSATTVLPTHEPWAGHPVSCKSPRGGTGDKAGATPGQSGKGTSTGGSSGGSSGSSSGGSSGSSSGGGTGQGAGVDSPTNGKTIKGLTEDQTKDYLDRLGTRESTNNYQSVNSIGFSGRWQFGTEALISTGYMTPGGTRNSRQNDASNWTGKNGVNSKQDWLNNQAAQTDATISLANQNHSYLSKTGALNGADASTTAGYLAAAHLTGAPAASRLAKSGTDSSDQNGTKASSYKRLMSDIGSHPGKKKKKNIERGDPRKDGEDKKDPPSANAGGNKPAASSSAAKGTSSAPTASTPAAYTPPAPTPTSTPSTTPSS